MEWMTCLKEVLNYIEEHLQDEIDITAEYPNCNYRRKQHKSTNGLYRQPDAGLSGDR